MDRFDSAVAFALQKNGYSELRENQRVVIEQYVNGDDALLCSPTGSGKSLIFEMAPFMFQYMENKDKECTCLVVSPLTALMNAQVEKLIKKNIKAVYFKDNEQKGRHVYYDIENGKYELIFASPETILLHSRALVTSLSKKRFLKVIFIDEAHCIKKFGKGDKQRKQNAYRPFYGCLDELRSLAGPTVPVVALTATASKTVKDIILKDLCMSDKTFQLTVTPNKPNIKYWVFETTRTRSDITKDFDWLVHIIRFEGPKTPR
ncbi:ATP-dependent DNA helicase RecQ-like [Mercenaria mercenaria]|uniref:ATP-dependent DNA helicase RecQ-like n=1 Tax=Mercenaria mercenaria TaxID=6596 RepID=UPI00234E3E99|nr:ATP-dependent DNA helicase RecQ-like [Mercenaria mercenaria]